MTRPTAVVIGAGPAGLTAALELCRRTPHRPVVLEATGAIGGLSQTVVHRGNRIDIGGHRFFSKSDRVVDWWLELMPLQQLAPGTAQLGYQRRKRSLPTGSGPDPQSAEQVMLLRDRRSRILHRSQFFDYPLQLDLTTLRKLGMARSLRIATSYGRAHALPREERSLEDFLVNRFGRELYRTFFRDYTEKVWGVPCTEISAEWGAQRIKGMSLRTALAHFLRNAVPGRASDWQEGETSLIEQFLYPKRGPGQLWETAAAALRDAGGELHHHHRVVGILGEPGRVRGVRSVDAEGREHCWEAELVLSSMPVQHLIAAMPDTLAPPPEVVEVARGLRYRGFITVGLEARQLRPKIREDHDGVGISDNWIYVQEPGVQVGRVQLFNNWSPWMVRDPARVWMGLEYFCDVGDALWRRSDEQLCALASEEAVQIGLVDEGAVLDAVAIRMPRAYPAYFGSYDRFPVIRRWLDTVEGLVLIGRNGMHRYNNQDHSMLSAMVAVDGIAAGSLDREAVWAVNTEDSYHEG
jgi:protoporphyrinogen oxidase